MKEFINKIEDFFFDFLGLILPGFIMILLVSTPLLLLDFKQVNTGLIEDSKIFSILVNLAKYVDYLINNSNEIVLIVIVLSSYIIGHLIKVLAILQYEFCSAIFDNFFNIIVIKIKNEIKKLIKSLFSKWINPNNRVIIFIQECWNNLYSPLHGLIIKIFTFKPPNYFSDNNVLRDDCINMINDKFKTDFPKKWYSLYKFSTVINNQESIKSLGYNFLAKYNFYRSMAFIFSLIFFYYLIFFQTTKNLLSENILSLKGLILISIVLFWFTFHYKYKRYWTLCGNEILVSLFYYMKKKYY